MDVLDLTGAVAEWELHSTELIAILDHIPAIVACWDADLVNLFAGRTFADWFDTTPEQIRGRHLRDVIGAEAFAKREVTIRAALAGRPQRFERVLVSNTGRKRHLQLEFIPRIVNQEPHGFFALGTDITACVAAAEQTRAAAEALAVMQDREQTADRVNALVTRQLYTAVLELSASLQPGLLDPQGRVRLAIEEIETAIKVLRSLLLQGPEDGVVDAMNLASP